MSATDEDAQVRGDSPDLREVAADPALVEEGWERRTMTEPGRVDELRELYASLGFEVLVQPLVRENFGASCEGCAESACTSYVLVYTRKPQD